MSTRFKYASCKKLTEAKAVIFGANTKTAGSSESYLGRKMQKNIFSGDFVRKADNESFALPENLRSGDKLFDMGNLSIHARTKKNEITIVKKQFMDILSQHRVGICLGGDHIVKYAALEAINELYNDCWIVYIDAHPDCNEIEKLNYSSILHWGFQLPKITPSQVSIVGLRQLNMAEAESFKKYQPYVVWGRDFVNDNIDKIYKKLKAQFSCYKKVYFSIDLDALEPSSVPAVEAPYPGGPSFNAIVALMHKIAKDFSVVGMDITEFIPAIDHLKITALTTARFVKELYSIL